MDPPRLLAALAFVADKHRDQRRKDAEASPYINHPIAVATVLAVESGVMDEELLIAAILHDTVEDTRTTFAELQECFGTSVASLVRELTDDKSLLKAERKRLQIANAPDLSAKAKQTSRPLIDRCAGRGQTGTTHPAGTPSGRETPNCSGWPLQRSWPTRATATDVACS